MALFDPLFNSTVIMASITGSGLIMTVYGIILPHSKEVIHGRIKKINELIKKTERHIEVLKTDSGNSEETEKIKELQEERTKLEGLPFYFHPLGILFPVFCFTLSAIFSISDFLGTATGEIALGLIEFTPLIFATGVGLSAVSAIRMFWDTRQGIVGAFEEEKDKIRKIEKQERDVFVLGKSKLGKGRLGGQK